MLVRSRPSPRITLTLDRDELDFAASVQDVGEDDVLPVAAIGHEPQVRQRSLGRPHLLFPPSKQVAEVDDHVAIAFPHVLRQNHDAGEVVVLRRLLLLKK